MKLNYKRTLLVGFAFFLICAFWQAYDTIIPLMLTNKFGLNQFWSGIIMALDNILALFMLPLFGALSDKKKSRFGKRTPFIFIGTICAVLCFMGVTFADKAQLNKLASVTTETYWEENATIENCEYNEIYNRDVAESYSVHEYAARVYYGKQYNDATDEEKAAMRESDELKQWYCGLDYEQTYVYDQSTNTYRRAEVDKKGSGLFGKTTYKYSDTGDPLDKKDRTTDCYSSLVSEAESNFAGQVMRQNWWIMLAFIVVLLMTLVSMAVFRSPAVALMPDVTVKPLRSKANAVINLMGTVGGILVLLLGIAFGTGKVQNQMMDYTWFVLTICAIMVAALIVFIFTVKENKWNKEMLEQQALLDEDETKQDADVKQETEQDAPSENAANDVAESETPQKQKKQRLPKDKLVSLILILSSVALWFFGYNAVTSKYSVYALNVLKQDYNLTLLIAQGAAIVSYIPVGILASKIGRKKSILIGVGLLTLSFGGAIFISQSTPAWVMYVLFALAGIAWATINVNSFPMVVELARGNDIGKYTGYYYTASMAAQVVTPVLSGALMTVMHSMKNVLFPYATAFVAMSFVTMIFVKHGDSKPEAPKDKMEMLAGADD